MKVKINSAKKVALILYSPKYPVPKPFASGAMAFMRPAMTIAIGISVLI